MRLSIRNSRDMAYRHWRFLCVALLTNSVFAQTSPGSSQTCTITSQYVESNGTIDDSPAIASAFAQCASGGTIVFSEGVDYNVFTPVSASNLSDVTIQVLGNLHLPQNVTAMQELYNTTTAASGSTNLYWFTFQGPGIQFVGNPNITTGWINSYGQAWVGEFPKRGTNDIDMYFSGTQTP